VSGFRSTGDNIEALWNVANPSSTGWSTVPLTCLIRKKIPIKKIPNHGFGDIRENLDM
jgi:hypothetical protein